MKGPKFRFSKKLLFVAMGSIIVLGGGSGAAAVFIGTNKILGPSYIEINGLKCTALETVKLKKDQHLWVRKYVVSDEAGDGMARIRTALRVARAVQEKEKADLVQVAMLDKAGPKDRAQMRGRTIGAQVIYIPDLKKAPDGIRAETFSAYYVDGAAAADGQYYGLRIDLPMEDAEAVTARLTDKADCVDPAPAVALDAHGNPVGAHSEKPKKGGKGKADAHGKPAEAHGAAPSAHGEAPAAGGHGAPAEGHGEVAAKESGGFFSSITGMIFGSKTEAPVAGDGADHAAAPAEGHDAPAADHGKPAVAANDRNGEKPAAKQTAAADHGSDKPAAAKASPKEAAAADVSKKDEGGFLSSLSGMIFGSSEAAKPADKPAAQAAKAPEQAAPEPRTSAEGGKRWSKSTDADAIRSDKEASAAPNMEPTPPPSDGSTDADAAGAAWLAKMRGKSGSAPTAAPSQAPAAASKPKPAKPDQEASAKPAKPAH